MLRLVALGATSRMGRGGMGTAPRPASVPSDSTDDELRALRISLTQHAEQQHALFQTLMHSVATLDTLVYEHDTQVIPPTQPSFSFRLQPQTAQTELIKGVFASIVFPTAAAAPAYTVQNAWAKIGDLYVNLNTQLSAAGAGGTLSGDFAAVVDSSSDRIITVVNNANWPAGGFLTFALFGEAIPTMDGGVLH